MPECIRHGRHGGIECPTCTQEAATLRAASINADAIAQQAERQVSAQREVQRAIEEGILANRALARDGWKLEVQSKVERSLELFKANLVEEASTLLTAALTQDPGNLHGHLLRSMIAEQRGEVVLHEEHTIKAIRLLGVSGSAASGAYRSVILAVHANAPDNVRLLLTEKLVEFARATSIDNSWLQVLSRKKWDDVIIALAPYLAPTLITRQLLQVIISNGCVNSGLLLTRNVLAAGHEMQHAAMWIVGSLVLIEIAVTHAKGDAESSIPRPSNWVTDEFAAIFELYADNAQWYREGFAGETVSRFHGLLREVYLPARKTIFERLVNLAKAYAAGVLGSMIAAGCGLALATYLLVGISFAAVISAMGGNKGIGVFIGLLLSPVGGVLGAAYFGNFIKAKRYNIRYAQLHHRQIAVERTFGVQPDTAEAVAT